MQREQPEERDSFPKELRVQLCSLSDEQLRQRTLAEWPISPSNQRFYHFQERRLLLQRCFLFAFVSRELKRGAYEGFPYEPFQVYTTPSTGKISDASKHLLVIPSTQVAGSLGVVLPRGAPPMRANEVALFYPGVLMTTKQQDLMVMRVHVPTGVNVPQLTFELGKEKKVKVAMIGDPCAFATIINSPYKTSSAANCTLAENNIIPYRGTTSIAESFKLLKSNGSLQARGLAGCTRAEDLPAGILQKDTSKHFICDSLIHLRVKKSQSIEARNGPIELLATYTDIDECTSSSSSSSSSQASGGKDTYWQRMQQSGVYCEICQCTDGDKEQLFCCDSSDCLRGCHSGCFPSGIPIPNANERTKWYCNFHRTEAAATIGAAARKAAFAAVFNSQARPAMGPPTIATPKNVDIDATKENKRQEISMEKARRAAFSSLFKHSSSSSILMHSSPQPAVAQVLEPMPSSSPSGIAALIGVTEQWSEEDIKDRARRAAFNALYKSSSRDRRPSELPSSSAPATPMGASSVASASIGGIVRSPQWSSSRTGSVPSRSAFFNLIHKALASAPSSAARLESLPVTADATLEGWTNAWLDGIQKFDEAMEGVSLPVLSRLRYLQERAIFLYCVRLERRGPVGLQGQLEGPFPYGTQVAESKSRLHPGVRLLEDGSGARCSRSLQAGDLVGLFHPAFLLRRSDYLDMPTSANTAIDAGLLVRRPGPSSGVGPDRLQAEERLLVVGLPLSCSLAQLTDSESAGLAANVHPSRSTTNLEDKVSVPIVTGSSGVATGTNLILRFVELSHYCEFCTLRANIGERWRSVKSRLGNFYKCAKKECYVGIHALCQDRARRQSREEEQNVLSVGVFHCTHHPRDSAPTLTNRGAAPADTEAVEQIEQDGDVLMQDDSSMSRDPLADYTPGFMVDFDGDGDHQLLAAQPPAVDSSALALNATRDLEMQLDPQHQTDLRARGGAGTISNSVSTDSGQTQIEGAGAVRGPAVPPSTEELDMDTQSTAQRRMSVLPIAMKAIPKPVIKGIGDIGGIGDMKTVAACWSGRLDTAVSNSIITHQTRLLEIKYFNARMLSTPDGTPNNLYELQRIFYFYNQMMLCCGFQWDTKRKSILDARANECNAKKFPLDPDWVVNLYSSFSLFESASEMHSAYLSLYLSHHCDYRKMWNSFFRSILEQRDTSVADMIAISIESRSVMSSAESVACDPAVNQSGAPALVRSTSLASSASTCASLGRKSSRPTTLVFVNDHVRMCVNCLALFCGGSRSSIIRLRDTFVEELEAKRALQLYKTAAPAEGADSRSECATLPVSGTNADDAADRLAIKRPTVNEPYRLEPGPIKTKRNRKNATLQEMYTEKLRIFVRLYNEFTPMSDSYVTDKSISLRGKVQRHFLPWPSQGHMIFSFISHLMAKDLSLSPENISRTTLKRAWQMLQFSYEVRLEMKNSIELLKCDNCFIYEQKIQQFANNPELKAAFILELALHRTEFTENRDFFNCRKCRADRWPHMLWVLSADGMDSKKTALPKPLQNTKNLMQDKLDVRVMGGIAYGAPVRACGLLLTPDTKCKGADASFTCVSRMLELNYDSMRTDVAAALPGVRFTTFTNASPPRRRPAGADAGPDPAGPDPQGKLPFIWPETLHFVCDNTAADFKNFTMVISIGLLVALGVFKSVLMQMLLVGHTHDVVDAMFGVWAQRLATSQVLTIGQLIEDLTRSYHSSTLQKEQQPAKADGESSPAQAAPAVADEVDPAAAAATEILLPEDQAAAVASSAEERPFGDYEYSQLARASHPHPSVTHLRHCYQMDSLPIVREKKIRDKLKGVQSPHLFFFRVERLTDADLKNKEFKYSSAEVEAHPQDRKPHVVLYFKHLIKSHNNRSYVHPHDDQELKDHGGPYYTRQTLFPVSLAASQRDPLLAPPEPIAAAHIVRLRRMMEQLKDVGLCKEPQAQEWEELLCSIEQRKTAFAGVSDCAECAECLKGMYDESEKKRLKAQSDLREHLFIVRDDADHAHLAKEAEGPLALLTGWRSKAIVIRRYFRERRVQLQVREDEVETSVARPEPEEARKIRPGRKAQPRLFPGEVAAVNERTDEEAYLKRAPQVGDIALVRGDGLGDVVWIGEISQVRILSDAEVAAEAAAEAQPEPGPGPEPDDDEGDDDDDDDEDDEDEDDEDEDDADDDEDDADADAADDDNDSEYEERDNLAAGSAGGGRGAAAAAAHADGSASAFEDLGVMGDDFKRTMVTIIYWVINEKSCKTADGKNFNPESVKDWKSFVERVGTEKDRACFKARLALWKKNKSIGYEPSTLTPLIVQQQFGFEYFRRGRHMDVISSHPLTQLLYWNEKKKVVKKTGKLTNLAAEVCLRDACQMSAADAKAIVKQRDKNGHVPLSVPSNAALQDAPEAPRRPAVSSAVPAAAARAAAAAAEQPRPSRWGRALRVRASDVGERKSESENESENENENESRRKRSRRDGRGR